MKFIARLFSATARRRSCTAATSGMAASRAAKGARRSAFSLIELMAVMAVVTVLTGISVPAVKGLTGANGLDASASKISGLLTLARSEAIAQHTVVRFVVAKEWNGNATEANLRRMSLWAWRADSASYEQLTPWEELPTGMVLEQQVPGYVLAAPYAANDATTVRGSSVLSEDFSDSADFAAGTPQAPIAGRFIEFLPSGAARLPNSAERRAIFVATQGYLEGQRVVYTAKANGQPANWAQVNVDTLTGRVQIYRP